MARTRPNSLVREDDDDGGADEGAMQGVFTKDGRPVYFYLYGTNEPRKDGALTEGQRAEMTRLITEHGGLVCQSAADSDTIIVAAAGFENLKKKYDLERDRYVELPAFVRLCISKGVYAHQPVARLPLSGVAPGRSRTVFTPEDDMNLCRFIASHMPDKAAGGRFGQKPYAELAEKVQYDDLDYQWVKRHPVQSWRERYKQGWRRLDPIIDDLVEENPPPKDGNGVRPYDRRVNNRARFFEAQVQEEEDGENELDREGRVEVEQDLEGDPKNIANAQSAGQRARRTDVGPRRSLTRAEEPSRRTRSMPGTKRLVDPEQDPDVGGGEFSDTPQDELDQEDDYRPGPEDAGPSQTQRTPSPPPESPQQAASQARSARLVKRELRAAARRGKARQPQVPMSSQATLVGPVPSQLRGAATAAKLPPSQPARPTLDIDSDDARSPAPAQKRASKRRKINPAPMPPPVVLLEPFRRAGVGSRSAPQTARKTAPRPINGRQAGPSSVPVAPPSPPRAAREEEEDEEDEEDELDVEMADAPRSDEQDVEALLQDISAEMSRELSPEAAEPSEDLDTDDQVSRDRLLRYAPRDREAEVEDADGDGDDDDEAFAKSLDLISAPRSRSVSVPGVLFPPGGPLRRTNTNASVASSALNVPLPGTRASEKKREARESERHVPYVPPSETRAAMVLRNRNVVR